jgi:protein SCO1/2
MRKKWVLMVVAAFFVGAAFHQLKNGTTVNEHRIATSEPVPHELTSIKVYGDNNQEISLFDAADPRIRLVYFGFTRCPDVCPTSLAMLAGALNHLNKKTMSQLYPIFISLDPERDNASDTAQYAHYFHSAISGGSASLSDTMRLADHYGVVFKKTKLDNSQLDYTLDHSSYFYFLTPDGRLLEKVPHTVSPTPIIDMIQLITSSEGQ